MPRVDEELSNTMHKASQGLRRAHFSRFALLGFVALFSVIGVTVKLQSRASANVYYVSPTGADTNIGTEAAPWKTVKKGLMSLGAGDTLMVRGGTYEERIQNPTTTPGTATAPIIVRAYPGERPVVSGLLWLKNPSYWTLDGINVTWGTTNLPTEHMTKMTDGVGWRITNAEIWGARSFAGLLVAGAPNQWRIDHSVFHDTFPTNDVNQDHLIYVNTDASNGSGTIERSVFYGSANGRGIKVGPPSSSSIIPNGAVTIRYNTFYNNAGPSNIQLSYGATGNQIYRNIMQKSGAGKANITWNNVSGTGNRTYENIGWESSAVADVELSDPSNQLRNPQFASLAVFDFHPLDVASQDYGRFAPGDTDSPTPTPTTTPVATPTPAPSPAPDVAGPSAPTLIASGVTATSVTLGWAASVDPSGVSGYDIFRGTTKLATITALTYTDTGLTAATQYTYTAIAKDTLGNLSVPSDQLVVTTLAPPPSPVVDTKAPTTPTKLIVTGVNATSVSLSWNKSTDNIGVDGYNIYRSDSTGAIARASSTTFLDKAVTKGKKYTYKIKAVDAAGNESSYSNSVSATVK